MIIPFYGILQSYKYKKSYPIRKSNQIALIFSGNIYIIPTPQIPLDTKQICLGDLCCGISVIHFALYYTAH